MHINRKIERFLRQHNMAPITFGRRVARDPRLVLDMRNGRCLRPAMAIKAEAFMAAYERRTKPLPAFKRTAGPVTRRVSAQS